MAYQRKNSIIVRRRQASLSGLFDDIKDVVTGAVDFYGNAKKNEGAAQSMQQQQTAAIPVSSGIEPSTLLLLGGLGIGAIILLKRKKS